MYAARSVDLDLPHHPRRPALDHADDAAFAPAFAPGRGLAHRDPVAVERLVKLRPRNVEVAGCRIVLRGDEPVAVRVHLQHAGDVVRVAGQRVAVAAQREDRPVGRECVQVPAKTDPLFARDLQALLQLPGGCRPREHRLQRPQQLVARHGVVGSRAKAPASAIRSAFRVIVITTPSRGSITT